jgi:hypothetical protein
MTERQGIDKEIYRELVKPRSYLWWWVRDSEKLSLQSVVEGVLAYGDMGDVEKLFHLVGRRKVADIFFEQISGSRCNYRPQTVNFFRKVFSRDV